MWCVSHLNWGWTLEMYHGTTRLREYLIFMSRDESQTSPRSSGRQQASICMDPHCHHVHFPSPLTGFYDYLVLSLLFQSRRGQISLEVAWLLTEALKGRCKPEHDKLIYSLWCTVALFSNEPYMASAHFADSLNASMEQLWCFFCLWLAVMRKSLCLSFYLHVIFHHQYFWFQCPIQPDLTSLKRHLLVPQHTYLIALNERNGQYDSLSRWFLPSDLEISFKCPHQTKR